MASWSDDAIYERRGEIKELALRRVEKTEAGCWLVKGGQTFDAYPRIVLPTAKGDKKVKKQMAHVLYVCEHGPVVGGKILLHLCGDQGCVNPAHMKPGTRQDMADIRLQSGNLGNEKRRGHLNGRSKLTEDQVRVIRKSPKTNNELAAEYGVDRRAIWGIKNRTIWKHVPDEEEA